MSLLPYKRVGRLTWEGECHRRGTGGVAIQELKRLGKAVQRPWGRRSMGDVAITGQLWRARTRKWRLWVKVEEPGKRRVTMWHRMWLAQGPGMWELEKAAGSGWAQSPWRHRHPSGSTPTSVYLLALSSPQRKPRLGEIKSHSEWQHWDLTTQLASKLCLFLNLWCRQLSCSRTSGVPGQSTPSPVLLLLRDWSTPGSPLCISSVTGHTGTPKRVQWQLLSLHLCLRANQKFMPFSEK